MESAYFDSKDPKYQTCFCHIETLTALISAFYFISGFISVIIVANLQPQYSLYLIPAVIILPFIFFATLYAIYSTNSAWLIPIMGLIGFQIFLSIAAFIFQIFDQKSSILNQQVTEELAYKLLGQIFGIFVSLWFFWIFYKCYGYLNEKRNAKKFQPLMIKQINAMNSMYPQMYAIPYENYPHQY
uniref:Transmembrane protein n=1 Tax=Panagrolaimus sp. PS1159 TaxID=55785 RepID=A0AC35FQ76_9BILA